ncbi:MAG: hypothetical protein WDM85_06045 [Caulobacteraceae bacterium]
MSPLTLLWMMTTALMSFSLATMTALIGARCCASSSAPAAPRAGRRFFPNWSTALAA